MNTFLIIDGLNLVRRIHAAQPDENDINGLDTRIGSACNKLIKYHNPTHVAIVWDGNATSWRKSLYGDYKKGRKPMPEVLANMLPTLKIYLSELNVNSIDAESEADDVIATLATKLVQNQGKAIIVSTDKGFTQLINPNIERWDHFNKAYITIEQREEGLGVERSQFIDYLALAGDSGNKIPGVPGIGAKSATELLKIFRSLSNIYGSLEQVGAKQAKKLEMGKQMAQISYKLVQLQTDISLKVNLNQFRIPELK